MKGFQLFIVQLLLLSSLGSVARSAKILGLFPTPFNSHNTVFQTLMTGLAARGHDIVVLSSRPQTSKVPNYTGISLEFMLPYVKDTVVKFMMNEHSAMEELDTMRHFGNVFCEMELTSPEVQNLIHSQEKFDLIIVEVFYSDCFVAFAHKFGVPFITISSFVAPPWVSDQVDNPETLSFIPNYLLPFTDKMNFWQRTQNFLFGLSTSLGRQFQHLPLQTQIARKYFGSSLPPLWELERNASLVFVNSDFSLDFPRPYVPSVVEIGGIHCRPPEELPKDLKDFVASSSDGFIYFSLGSILRSDEMPEHRLNIFLDAFSELPQKVLWKFETNISRVPNNILLKRWIPQQDILGHPNIKVFITHGGLLSFQEAVYHGVPLVVIPINADQKRNAKKVVETGLGVELNYHTLTKSSLQNAIRTVIKESRYQANVKRLSAIFRDQMTTPLERAIYWTEYVIRHDGAYHLRTAANDLTWFQYFLCDVVLVILLFIGVIVWLLRKCLLLLYGKDKYKWRHDGLRIGNKFRFILIIMFRKLSF